ncbi:hypothetical protein [Actinomadura macrotermitis]|uniref:Uncharacterized protein n=1 Tax=Actinomadura macrotermitis TaxID=2585200 RepID=A0A7K0C230_9ACTN|nr:hypothetical protein [Actinomadura macrotermitis]MQY07523.1 hypothetical protein [Actinomadura macrotermitis]
MTPLIIELEPLQGAGPIPLGAPFEEAGRALAAWGTPQPYAPYPGAEPLDWRLADSAVGAHVHCGSKGTVQTIELYRHPETTPQAQVLLLGLDVFATPAEQVIAHLRAHHDVVDEHDGHDLAVPSLSIGMSRPMVPDPDEDDEETIARYTTFTTVLLAGPGYYDPPPRR